MSKEQLVGIAVAAFLASAAESLQAQIPTSGISTSVAATAPDVQAAALAAIPVLLADSAAATTLAAEYARQIASAKSQIDALNQQIKQIGAQIARVILAEFDLRHVRMACRNAALEHARQLVDQEFSFNFEMRTLHAGWRSAREGTRTPKDCSTRS